MKLVGGGIIKEATQIQMLNLSAQLITDPPPASQSTILCLLANGLGYEVQRLWDNWLIKKN